MLAVHHYIRNFFIIYSSKSMLLISATHKLRCYSNLSDGNKLVDISYLLTYV